MRTRLLVFRIIFLATLAGLLPGCATLRNEDPLKIDVAGVESLKGEGMELRMAVKLRVQNPNDSAVDYRGVALDLDVNDQRLASGVSDETGTVPRYGETVIVIPVTVSAFSVIKQVARLAQQQGTPNLSYRVHGKLDGGLFGTRRFEGTGTLDLSGTRLPPAGD